MQLPIYNAEDEQLLMSKLWSPSLKDDPEAFVLYVFPWGQKGTPLEYFTGPRKWQRKVLRKFADHIRANKQREAFEVLRSAIESGNWSRVTVVRGPEAGGGRGIYWPGFR